MNSRRSTVASTALALLLVATLAAPVSAATTDPNDGQWYISWYDIKEFHAAGIDGSGVTVAVVDTAINLDVPQLQGADIEVKEPSQCYAEDGSEQSSVSDDPALALHGTNVVSYIVGNGTGYDGQPGITGIAPKAKILFYSVRTQDGCLPASGDSLFPWEEMISTAIIDATDKGADIINFSVEAYLVDINDAIAYAMRHDVIVVASLKNQDSQDFLENDDGNPARNNGVIGVGSFGPDGEVMLDAFGEPSTSDFVDVVAPGVQMLIQGSETDWRASSISQGNSFAAPIVSGNLALAIQKYPDATHNQIMWSMISNTGASAHELLFDSKGQYGFGIVDTISFLAVDPTQYKDVHPFLAKGTTDIFDGPSFDDIYGDQATASPSPSTSGDPTPTATQHTDDPAGDSTGPNWLLIGLIGGGLILIGGIIAIIIVLAKSSPKNAGPHV